MLTLIFIILMFTVFGKLAVLAIKMAWGITKVLFSIVFLPIVLIVMFMSGLTVLAIPILVILGVTTLIAPGNAS